MPIYRKAYITHLGNNHYPNGLLKGGAKKDEKQRQNER